MYTYQYAVGRYRYYQPGFHVIDISRIPVADLNTYFSVLDIVLYDERFKRNVKITLDDYVNTFSNDKRTIGVFLEETNTVPLKYSLDVPKNEYVYARWESPYHSGFYPHPANINLASDKQEKLTSQSAPDIRLLRDNYTYSDYKSLSDNALFIVNGCFVRAEGISSGLYLHDVGKDYQKFKQDIYVSAINFERIGRIETIPVTKEMVRADEQGRKYFIDISNTYNLKNKTVWLVFNGQLFVDEDVVSYLGRNTLLVDAGYIDLLSHYITYSQYTRTPTWVDQSKADSYIIEAICAHNSFIVLIDNPTVGVTIKPLIRYLYPLSHQTEETFKHPIVLENGLFPYCYRRTYGIKDRIVNTDVGHAYLPILESTGNLSDNFVYTGMNKGQAGRLPRAYLFEITGITK